MSQTPLGLQSMQLRNLGRCLDGRKAVDSQLYFAALTIIRYLGYTVNTLGGSFETRFNIYNLGMDISMWSLTLQQILGIKWLV